MLKIKIGDKVKVMSGKDKGRDGVIERVFSKKMTAIVPEINVYKKHVKGIPGRKGGIYDIPRPISLSRLMLICPKCSKTTRVGFKRIDNKSVRMCKKCGREIVFEKKGK